MLLVWGDRDRLVFHSGAERVLSAVPGARLELLRGIGHCPQVEAPERVAELLLDFCAVRAGARRRPDAPRALQTRPGGGRRIAQVGLGGTVV